MPGCISSNKSSRRHAFCLYSGVVVGLGRLFGSDPHSTTLIVHLGCACIDYHPLLGLLCHLQFQPSFPWAGAPALCPPLSIFHIELHVCACMCLFWTHHHRLPDNHLAHLMGILSLVPGGAMCTPGMARMGSAFIAVLDVTACIPAAAWLSMHAKPC